MNKTVRTPTILTDKRKGGKKKKGEERKERWEGRREGEREREILVVLVS